MFEPWGLEIQEVHVHALCSCQAEVSCSRKPSPGACQAFFVKLFDSLYPFVAKYPLNSPALLCFAFHLYKSSSLLPCPEFCFCCRSHTAATDNHKLGWTGLPGGRFPSRYRGHSADHVSISCFFSRSHSDHTPEAGFHWCRQGYPHVCSLRGKESSSCLPVEGTASL